MFYNEPLSHRMRPRTIDEVVGQDDVIGPKTALYRMLQNGHIPSLLSMGRQVQENVSRFCNRKYSKERILCTKCH